MLKELKDKIHQLQESENFNFTYQGIGYILSCYGVGPTGEKYVAVHKTNKWGRSMNIDKITDNYIILYDFNMMDVKSTYKMSIKKIIL